MDQSLETYLELLNNQVWHEIADWPDIDDLIWQQDGAPPHFAHQVTIWLNENFPGRWLGQRGPFDEWPTTVAGFDPGRFLCLGHCEGYCLRTARQFN